MYPELFSIGNLTIYSYGMMIALAIIVTVISISREAPKENLISDHILEAVIAAAFAGMIGARLLYVMLNWSYFSANPMEIIFAQFAGLSFFGGLFLGTFVLYIWSAWRKIGFLRITDLLAPYLILGYAFGRIGCFLNGCCYGQPSDLPWALPISMADDVLRHPVQLYAALGAIVIFIILKMLRSRRPFVGFIMIALFALYGILRFTTEFFRLEEQVFLGLTFAQVFSLALTLFSVIIIITINRLQRRISRAPGLKKGAKR